jgi:hypothetical protein
MIISAREASSRLSPDLTAFRSPSPDPIAAPAEPTLTPAAALAAAAANSTSMDDSATAADPSANGTAEPPATC